MSLGLIKILPSHIANQIAAGEVVQRPASVVKELLENAIDAQSTHIQLTLVDSGRTLIQVLDNGTGMIEEDLVNCFLRHATSKIQVAEDLFALSTKGFRGEALPSIASVAQVEVQSRTDQDVVGNLIEISGSEVIRQEPCSCPKGTKIDVRNLFFNIPARRKFLKSNASELRHCMDEFERVALLHPEISMTFIHQGEVLYDLPVTNLKKRIIHCMGKTYEDFLMPIDEKTELTSFNGYLIKPSHSKKTKGNQYLFINQRYIKNNYLHHAIKTAYEELIPENYMPGYFIYMQVPTDKIDVNIHPTKTEVKLEDERFIYSILKSAVKKSIGQYVLHTNIDFSPELSFLPPVFDKNRQVVFPKISSNPSYNPFATFDQIRQEKKALLSTVEEAPIEQEPSSENVQEENWMKNMDEANQSKPFKFLFRGYLMLSVKSGLMCVHLKRAWAYLQFQRSITLFKDQKIPFQTLLFPLTLTYSKQEFSKLMEYKSTMQNLGFDMDDFGSQTIIFRGIPQDISESDVSLFVDEFIQFVNQHSAVDMEEVKTNFFYRLCDIKANHLPDLNTDEQQLAFIDELFSFEQIWLDHRGRKMVHILSMDEFQSFFD